MAFVAQPVFDQSLLCSISFDLFCLVCNGVYTHLCINVLVFYSVDTHFGEFPFAASCRILFTKQDKLSTQIIDHRRLGVAISGQPTALLLPRSSTKTALVSPKRCGCGPSETGSEVDAVAGLCILCWTLFEKSPEFFRSSSDHDKATFLRFLLPRTLEIRYPLQYARTRTRLSFWAMFFQGLDQGP